MTAEHEMTQAARKPRRRLKAALVATSLVTAAVTGYAVTSAVFSEQTTVGGNTFTAGTINFTSVKNSGLTVSNMMPGDVVYGGITVDNTSGFPIHYSATATSNEAYLGQALTYSIKQTAGTTCDATAFAGGTAITHGADTWFAKQTGSKIIGDATSGVDAGDRPLTATGTTKSENLCFQITLPLSTAQPNIGGKTATIDLAFNGENG
jgi:hypothetical protein